MKPGELEYVSCHGVEGRRRYLVDRESAVEQYLPVGRDCQDLCDIEIRERDEVFLSDKALAVGSNHESVHT
jgi:hypothetical protein